MNKPTTLDHLTAPTVTPNILRIRAVYWRIVAARNERAGRGEQARRLRINCDAMDRQADEFETAVVPSITAPMKAMGRKTAKRDAAAPSNSAALVFWQHHTEAVAAINAVYGSGWAVASPFGDTILVTIPPRLLNNRTMGAMRIRNRPDRRIPAAKYWPAGRLPHDLILHADHPRETADREWGDPRNGDASNKGYQKWFAKWAKANRYRIDDKDIARPRKSIKVAA